MTTYFLGYKIIGAFPPISGNEIREIYNIVGGPVSQMALNIMERFNFPLLDQ